VQNVIPWNPKRDLRQSIGCTNKHKSETKKLSLMYSISAYTRRSGDTMMQQKLGCAIPLRVNETNSVKPS